VSFLSSSLAGTWKWISTSFTLSASVKQKGYGGAEGNREEMGAKKQFQLNPCYHAQQFLLPSVIITSLKDCHSFWI
jgi:hypothetical protein